MGRLSLIFLLLGCAIAPAAYADSDERIIVLNSRLVGRDAAA